MVRILRRTARDAIAAPGDERARGRIELTKAGRIMALTAMLASLTFAAGCVPLRSHQGYIIDADLVNSVQPGVDNRGSVLQTLGKPSFASQFNTGDWYYIARDSRNMAYLKPKAKSQLTLKISFTQAGVVSGITRTGRGSDRLDRSVWQEDADAGPQARLLRGIVRQYRRGRRGRRRQGRRGRLAALTPCASLTGAFAARFSPDRLNHSPWRRIRFAPPQQWRDDHA